MRGLLLFSLLLSNWLIADDAAEAFDVSSVISAPVEKLEPPRWYPEIVSWTPAITTSDEMAQRHVVQGMALIHAGWDFEAYRHFCEAAKKDPQCLMAFWGIAFSLVQPNSEVNEERAAALERMFDLVDAGFGTENEKAQVRALAQLFSDEPELSPDVFATTARLFPNDLQMRLIASFLKKDGYDVILGEGLGQRTAVAEITEITKQHPESQMARLFWLSVQADHLDGPGYLRKELLPKMRALEKLAPDFPPYQQMLGHFEWRAGNLRLAQKAFARASALYAEYMKTQEVAVADCPNWVRAKLYEATTHHSLGEFDQALAIATELKELPLPDERIQSPGGAILLWEGRTLGARLYQARGQKGDFANGMDALPPKQEGQRLAKRDAVVLAWEGWRHSLAARDAMENEKMQKAAVFLEFIEGSDELLGGVTNDVLARASRSYWARARNGLTVSWNEGQGIFSSLEKESEQSRAAFWFKSAVDEQNLPSGMMPPILLRPLELSLAEWYADQKDQPNADSFYKKAMERRPNDVNVLSSYASWLEASERAEAAASIREHIGTVSST